MTTTVRVVRQKTHRVLPAIRFRFDVWLLLSVAALLVFGLMMVYDTTFDLGLLIQDDPLYYFQRQLVAAALGIIGCVVIMQFDYHILRRFSVLIMLGTLASLAFLLFFGAESELGATRGLFNDSFQPAEAAKLATIMYISHWISSKGERIKDLTYGLLAFSVITGFVCFLIVQQPALSTTGLVALISFTLFFVAGAEWKQIAIVGGVGGSIFVSLMLTLPHAAARVGAWREVLRDPNQAVWQVKQALIALGSGGFWGVGLGEGVQKFGPLPFPHTDAVFAIIGEELGLVGCLVVIALLLFVTWRGIRIARNARDTYGFLLALGITVWLAYQSLMNIAVITATIPFTGVPLPFISYGGSSMLISLLGVGILLNISRDEALAGRVTMPQPVKERE